MIQSMTRLIVSVAMVVCISSAWAAESPVVEEQDATGTAPAEKGNAPDPAKPNVLTQRDFALKLIQDLNLGSLPKKPKDKHLQGVLDGRRTFVFEAEDYYNKRQDSVTLRVYDAIGTFSGKGWLHVGADPATVTFRARLPLAGVYRMKVRGAGDGQIWSIGGRAIKIDCGPSLAEKDLGTVILDAEMMNFNVILPGGGAVDVITLTASDLPPVQPAAGWQFDAPLTYGVVADVAAHLLNKSLTLADDPAVAAKTIPVAGNASLPAGVSLVTDQIFGRFIGDGWFRNGYAPAKLELPFQVETTAFYGVKAYWLGEQFSGTLDGVMIEGRGKKYLEWLDLGVHSLVKGKHLLQVDLPPMAGISAIEIRAKSSGEVAYLKLLGWPQQASQVVPPADLERLVKDIATRYLVASKK